MNNQPYWENSINDPLIPPSEEIERVKQLRKHPNLTRSYDDWNYNQQMANNTFSIRAAFDTVIETMERSYYHDMMESDQISGFYSHTSTTEKLIATNADPSTHDGIGGGIEDRIPNVYLDPAERGRTIPTSGLTVNDHGNIGVNPITKRTQPDTMEDPSGKNLAVKLGVTWFKYVWTWDYIEPMNRELFERTKLMNRWLDKNTFCKYHDIWQHSLLVYLNGLSVNDFSVMYTQHSNMLKLPFDKNIYLDIQKGNPVDLKIYRIASRKHYWASLNYDICMGRDNGIMDSDSWSDYYDLFDPMNTDLIILNLCEQKSNANLGYRDQEQTELLQGPQTSFLHVHRREDGSGYIDLHELDPQVLSWWRAVTYVNADLIRPKNMYEYSPNGEYPYPVNKDPFPEESDLSTHSYDAIYEPIDLTHDLQKSENGESIGVSEEDLLIFKQYKNDSPDGRGKLLDGWRPTNFHIRRTYPNTFQISRSLRQNDEIEVRPYLIYYDALSNIKAEDQPNPDLGVTQVILPPTEQEIDPLPNARVFYFTKTLYQDTKLDPIVLRVMKTARRYLFNPYRYTPPTMGNLPVGTEFIIRENGYQEEKWIVLNHDYPVKGKTLCIRKYAIPYRRTLPDGIQVEVVPNHYLDFYQEEFTTPMEHQEWVNGDHSHLWGRFSPNALLFLEKESIPYFDAQSNQVGYIPLRFFDASLQEVFGYNPFSDLPQYQDSNLSYSSHSDYFDNLTSRICYTDESETVAVKWRLRDQSRSMMKYQNGNPSYLVIDETGQVLDDQDPLDPVYLRPCILIDNEYDFNRWNKVVDGIHVTMPESLQPYPLTHWSDSELLRVMISNPRYFRKYIAALFPDDNDYKVEKFYKYSDWNMANLMDIVEHVPDINPLTDGIDSAPYGRGNSVEDHSNPMDVDNTKKWLVTKATVSYLPARQDPHTNPEAWKTNYTIGSHIETSNGVHLVVNMAEHYEPSPILYKKELTIQNGGSGYLVTDKLYIRDQNDSEYICRVGSVDSNGSILTCDLLTWVDNIYWMSDIRVLGGHGQNASFTISQEELPQPEDQEYYPYVGMPLHIEHDVIYDYNPAGSFLETKTLSGTGEGMLVKIESENIPYSPERDREMWMYPFDYLTLKLRNFISLYPDNYLTYLNTQYHSPIPEWSIRVFPNTDLTPYKRYHSGNILTYDSHFDLQDGTISVEFLLPKGQKIRLGKVIVYREIECSYDDKNGESDGEWRIYGRPKTIAFTGDLGKLLSEPPSSTCWLVKYLSDDFTWIDTPSDPEFTVSSGIRLEFTKSTILKDLPDKFTVDDVENCSLHWEFLEIRGTLRDELFQQPVISESFDRPQFLIKFNNAGNTKISYQPLLGGYEKDFCRVTHVEDDDYVYYDWEEVYQLKNSHIDKKKEVHNYYRVKNTQITSVVVGGKNYHAGQELWLTCMDENHPAYRKVILLAIVDRVLPTPTGSMLEFHIHDHQRVIQDYDPTGHWRAVPADTQRQDDRFHVGNGEQNSLDDWERIMWFSDPANQDTHGTPEVELVGEWIETEEIPNTRYYVEVNNTFLIRKLYHYHWEEDFSLPAEDPNWGEGKILHPAKHPNPDQEIHLEDLKIVDTNTNELVSYDVADGQEVFTLMDVEPDVNRSYQFQTRYDMKRLQIREYNLNLKQILYHVEDIQTNGLRYVSDIRRMVQIDQVNIDPNATEWVDTPITIENIEVGNKSTIMEDYYIPEETFRTEWNIPSSTVFDHRDYTFKHLPMVDTSGKVILYADLDVRHTTLPFSFHGGKEEINNQTKPRLNNRPDPPIGPSHPEWTDKMRYYPSTDEYVSSYSRNGGISPSNVNGVIWKPDVYPFPFQLTDKTENVAMGTSSHAVENSYIRIKHIYNIQPADGVKSIPRSSIWASPSSQYNNDVPEAYTVAGPIDPNNRNTYHRNSDGFSYVDPPILTDLAHYMKPYTGIVFTYAEGYIWKYDQTSRRYVKTSDPVSGYERRLFHIGLNEYQVTLNSDNGEYQKTVPVRIYIGKRETPPTIQGNWVLQEAYQHTRPAFDNQNYQHRQGNMPYKDGYGRGQYVQFFALETFFDPMVSGRTSGMNSWSGNFGYPDFHYPEPENPTYHARYLLDGNWLDFTLSKDDPYYPTNDPNYMVRIHESSMRNAGYLDADYTPYNAQFALWYELPELILQGSVSSDSVPSFQQDWIEPYQIHKFWDYEETKTKNTEKRFTIDCYSELDPLRNDLHWDHVHHATITITLWQSQDPRDGFVQHLDAETNLQYGVKWEVDMAERQYVPLTKISDDRWNIQFIGEEDSWWKHSRKPIRIPYSFHGKILRETGIDVEAQELHRGDYWVYIVPRLYHQGALIVAGTVSEINGYPTSELNIEDQCIVMDPSSPLNNQLGIWNGRQWIYHNLKFDENISFTVLYLHGKNTSGTIAYLDGQFQEYNDVPLEEFSPDGDRYEFYSQTKLYKIYTAYEQGIIEQYSVFGYPTVNVYDFSYLFASEYYPYLIAPVHSEKIDSAIPYFFLGYQKCYAQIVNTFKEEIMWIPIWTYIGEGTPPYDEDDPDREWHSIDQQYLDIYGKSHPVQIAYHKDQFPVDFPEKIKETHHTYFNQTKDIFFTCKTTSRKIRKHDLQVFVLPRDSVQELDCGYAYTDIQYQVRIKGPAGNYKAIIDLSPQVATDDEERPFSQVSFDLITTEDRMTIRGEREDGSTYSIPMLNAPSLRKPLRTIHQDGKTSQLEFHRYKSTDKWVYTQMPYPKNPVWFARCISRAGLIDLNYPYLKRIWFRSPFDSRRYEIWVNGRLLTEGDQYTVITPTKILLHGLTSLHNVIIYEINREPHKEIFRPTDDMRNKLDAIVGGYAVDSTYQNEFDYEEQTNILDTPAWPQVSVDSEHFPQYPYNFDTDEDILSIPDGVDDSMLEKDYLVQIDMPYIEGAPLVTNVQWDDYYPYPAAGMDTTYISNQEVTDIFRDIFTIKATDGRHDLLDEHIQNQFRIMWNKWAQSDQSWMAPSVPPVLYPNNYLGDDRYKDHFPQYNKLFSEQKDRLYHDPSIPQYPMLLERDWNRYYFLIPNAPLHQEFRILWNHWAQSQQNWQLLQLDPQICHGGRWNWKGWHKPKELNDKDYYVLWKMNSKANPEKPWENQKNRSYYEPDKVYVETNPNHYWSYLGDWIKDHYYSIDDPKIGQFQGYPGWYPWINPSAPYESEEVYWDTGRYGLGTPGGLTQSPYDVQVSNNPTRQHPEIYQYQDLGNNTYQIWVDGIYEGDYSQQQLEGVNSVRIRVYNRTKDTLIWDIVNPDKIQQPNSYLIRNIEEGNVYEIFVDVANRAGIRGGKGFILDKS